MKISPTADEINSLFVNDNPEEVWQKADDIVRRISPAHDSRHARIVFDDVMRLFRGEYPGFCPIGTLYHDRQHTLDVFLCAVRLMHGVHISGTRMADDEITLIMMAALMHDVGYAQRVGEESGTGAQFTQSHVNRSIEFMQQYIVEKHLPSAYAAPLKHILLCTNPTMGITDIQFSDEHTRLLGKILGTADLIGQMADRNYLEKLLFLRMEFEEAHIGNDQNIHDLLRNTQLFYEATKLRLCEQFGSIGAKLSFYFKDWYGVENNYYLESIEKNISYLARITALNDETHLAMLKRGGIVKKLSPG